MSSFNTGENWADDNEPTSGNDYFTGEFGLRTPTTSSNYTFEGDSLTIDGGQLIYKVNGDRTITVENLTFSDGSFGQGGGSGGTGLIATLDGNITLAAGKFGNFNTGVARTINITAPISGSGEFRTQNTGTLNLQGINSYTGNTVISDASTTFNLIDNAGMLFSIGASGVNNSVSGLGNANFNHTFSDK